MCELKRGEKGECVQGKDKSLQPGDGLALGWCGTEMDYLIFPAFGVAGLSASQTLTDHLPVVVR